LRVEAARVPAKKANIARVTGASAPPASTTSARPNRIVGAEVDGVSAGGTGRRRAQRLPAGTGIQGDRRHSGVRDHRWRGVGTDPPRPTLAQRDHGLLERLDAAEPGSDDRRPARTAGQLPARTDHRLPSGDHGQLREAVQRSRLPNAEHRGDVQIRYLRRDPHGQVRDVNARGGGDTGPTGQQRLPARLGRQARPD